MTVKELRPLLFDGCDVKISVGGQSVLMTDIFDNLLCGSFDNYIIKTVYIEDVQTFNIELLTGLIKE